MNKMYNYFVAVTEQGSKKLYATVYRAPLSHSLLSDSVEHYMGRGKWQLDCRRDPMHPLSGHRLQNRGAKKFPGDGRVARAFMRATARKERGR